MTTDTETHGGHVIGPFTMSSLQSLHSVKIIDDPDHITHPEAVVLDDREAGKGSSSSYLCLLKIMQEDTSCSRGQADLTLSPVPASSTTKWSDWIRALSDQISPGWPA